MEFLSLRPSGNPVQSLTKVLYRIHILKSLKICGGYIKKEDSVWKFSNNPENIENHEFLALRKSIFLSNMVYRFRRCIRLKSISA